MENGDKCVLQPSKKKASINAEEWPLLLKVRIGMKNPTALAPHLHFKMYTYVYI